MIEPHVHCGECLKPIALQEETADGRIVDVAIESGTQFRLRQVGPNQLEPVEVPVPLCQECIERIKQQKANVPSKLIVPTPQVPPNLKPV